MLFRLWLVASEMMMISIYPFFGGVVSFALYLLATRIFLMGLGSILRSVVILSL